MAYPLRFATAGQIVPIGRFLDSVDGDTEEVALTILNTDVKLHKAGASSIVNKNSGGGTHMANAIYRFTFDATDSNTLGPMMIYIHVPGALEMKLECIVHTTLYYDAFILGTEFFPIDGFKQIWSVVGLTQTVKKPDGTTTAYTKALGTNTGAEPVISST